MRLVINIALGLQVLLGALVTGIGAATDGRTGSIITSVFGAPSDPPNLSTLALD
jgi:hypothetical protein